AEHCDWDTAFMQFTIDVVRHHHERYDGTGYPERLAGDAIPLAARFVALADTYDALRLRHSYRPGLSHSEAVKTMAHNSPGQFDPRLLNLFEQSAGRFQEIFGDTRD